MNHWVAGEDDHLITPFQFREFFFLAILNLEIVGRRITPARESKETYFAPSVINQFSITAAGFHCEQAILDGDVPLAVATGDQDFVEPYVVGQAREAGSPR